MGAPSAPPPPPKPMGAPPAPPKIGGNAPAASGSGEPAGGGQATVVPASGSGDFSPGQLEQLKSIVSSLVPTPAVEANVTASAGKPVEKAAAKTGTATGTLSPLQVALVNSMFGGKIVVKDTTTAKDFAEAAKAKWAVRAVPDGITKFLEEAGESAPKSKDQRCAAFWQVLSGMS